MNTKMENKTVLYLARISTIILFLALIRTLAEPFRLQYHSQIPVTFEMIKLYVVGAVEAALGLLILTILGWYGKNRMVIAFVIIIIIILSVTKYLFA